MKLNTKTFKLLEESFIDTEVKDKGPAKDDVNAATAETTFFAT